MLVVSTRTCLRVPSVHEWACCTTERSGSRPGPASSAGRPRPARAAQGWPLTGNHMAGVSMNQRRHLCRSTGSFLTNAVNLRCGGAASVPLHMGSPRSISRLSPFMGHRRAPLTDGAFVETSRRLSAGVSSDARIPWPLSWAHLSVLTNGAPFPLPPRGEGWL